MKASRETTQHLHMTNEGPPTSTISWVSSQTRINNTVDLLTHLYSRVKQRIEEKDKHSSQYLAEEEFYMHPLIHIEASIKVVFYHNPHRKFGPWTLPASLGPCGSHVSSNDNTGLESQYNHSYWTNLFKHYGGLADYECPNASAIDIIYPPRDDNEKQKLCEYEKLYDMNSGESGIRESNQAVRKAAARQQKLAEDAIAAAAAERKVAEREAAAAQREAAAAAKGEAAAAEAAAAAQQAMLAKQNTPWNRVKNAVWSVIPPIVPMGGKSKRARTQKRLSKSKKSIKRNSQRHRKTSRKH